MKSSNVLQAEEGLGPSDGSKRLDTVLTTCAKSEKLIFKTSVPRASICLRSLWCLAGLLRGVALRPCLHG